MFPLKSYVAQSNLLPDTNIERIVCWESKYIAIGPINDKPCKLLGGSKGAKGWLDERIICDLDDSVLDSRRVKWDRSKTVYAYMRQTHISINISKCRGEKGKKGNDDSERNCVSLSTGGGILTKMLLYAVPRMQLSIMCISRNRIRWTKLVLSDMRFVYFQTRSYLSTQDATLTRLAYI